MEKRGDHRTDSKADDDYADSRSECGEGAGGLLRASATRSSLSHCFAPSCYCHSLHSWDTTILAKIGKNTRGGARMSSGVIRVQVPIDLTTVRETASSAFSAITPMRVDALLALAVNEVLGPRAPGDKRARCYRSTMDGLANGSFVLDIDGRVFSRPDEVVVCTDRVTLRFFCSSLQAQPIQREA